MPRILRLIAKSAFVIATFCGVHAADAADTGPLFDLSSLRNVRAITPQGTPLTALPLNSPPIGGFAPQVVFGLTDEQAPGDISFAAHFSSAPGGNSLPRSLPPRYFVATFDTGAQSHIVRYDDAEIFNLATANRLGNYSQPITGASGSEESDITDGLGIYLTGLQNASVSGGSTINVTPGALRGQWNTSVLTTLPGSILPNIIGTPILAEPAMGAGYQVVLRNSQARHLTVAGETVRSPQVDFQPINTSLPAGYSRLSLEILSGNGVSPDATYFPSLDNFNNWADNPAAPTFWASPFARANGSHTVGSFSNEQFLFDTGAEVTVLSEDTAAQVGFYTGGPEPSTPDFFVEVQGVGGTTLNVPGFYMQNLSVTTNGGPISWTNVPVIVLNLPDPRDFIGFVPGILGMNLFTDRDLIVNGGTSNPHIGISPIWQWNVNTGGNWSDSSKWTLAIPNAIDAQANFYGKITSPQTITVDGAGFTVGTMNFDNSNRYTIAGPGRITLEASLNDAQIRVSNGSHTISAPMTFASDTSINVVPAASRLTISGDVTATGKAITKQGSGALEMKNIRAGSLAIDAGAVIVTANGTSAATSVVSSLSIFTDSGTSAKLDLNNNFLIIDYTTSSPIAAIRQYLVSGYAGGAWNGAGGIVTSMPNVTNFALGFAENSALNKSTFGGIDVDLTSILVRYTRLGDASLNGLVNLEDFNILAGNFGLPNRMWFQADFNYDGFVNLIDFNMLAGNFGLTAGPDGPTPQDWAALAAVVPEPSISLLTCSAIAISAAMFRRRRLR